VRQEINRAINQVLEAHPEARIVYENLSVASMRFHARAMNAYLYASQLGHIPKQLAWAAAKRGMAAHTVNPAYSSQECPRCHFVSRAKRPDQKTFRCVVCGYQAHADHKAALTLASRWGDPALAGCKTKEAVKALLLRRHERWKQAQAEQHPRRVEEIGPAIQSSLWDGPERFEAALLNAPLSVLRGAEGARSASCRPVRCLVNGRSSTRRDSANAILGHVFSNYLHDSTCLGASHMRQFEELVG
jgi:hypothetical protein